MWNFWRELARLLRDFPSSGRQTHGRFTSTASEGIFGYPITTTPGSSTIQIPPIGRDTTIRRQTLSTRRMNWFAIPRPGLTLRAAGMSLSMATPSLMPDRRPRMAANLIERPVVAHPLPAVLETGRRLRLGPNPLAAKPMMSRRRGLRSARGYPSFDPDASDRALTRGEVRIRRLLWQAWQPVCRRKS